MSRNLHNSRGSHVGRGFAVCVNSDQEVPVSVRGEGMRRVLRTLGLMALLLVAPASAWAQATLAGVVTDASGAVLPGVTVEASSSALIEKVRSATTDCNGRYRIESLQPGQYSVTFSLSGFAPQKREGVILTGSGVISINGELKVGGVQETITVTGESPVVDVASTKRELTLDNETMRNLPAVRSYSYLLNTVPGMTSNITDVNTGPVFAIFPVHGRSEERRVGKACRSRWCRIQERRMSSTTH